ncbi:ABC transporter ATP-binding protein [Pseudoroseicyclus tamaricis]|uniref:ATP-binding cassette domain-containing protein n=1 Tax=Pseudoroseicyclus tamaricis TaxID=2705421 RepID=A0A6B2JY84_9RHOB|nr:oligopeptide/dipeptide ABC transporter ATP-binding protein [Pseudoroseicyclus tamaricis]NDV01254.1 ATP-binding cassette domain-containing protein [Pseudoroseicyclus tamaricis]
MSAVLKLTDLQVHHDTARGALRAVDGISLEIARGETLGLVGESGCGKSTLARCVTGIDKPNGGSVEIEGVTAGRGKAARLQRARNVQMIFQDPSGALNPRLQVERIITEPLSVAGEESRSAHRTRAIETARKVGLSDYHLERMPHELSGGQRQRVSIARALVLNPNLLVCDEAVSALDVSVQAQVLNLLLDIQKELGLSYLFISHDLAVVRYISHRIAVMYLGRIVEIGAAEDVWASRLHPYTQALIHSIPEEAAKTGRTVTLEGDVPSPVNPPSGCAFRTRCPFARAACAEARPELRAVGSHEVACHFAEEIAAGSGAEPERAHG